MRVQVMNQLRCNLELAFPGALGFALDSTILQTRTNRVSLVVRRGHGLRERQPPRRRVGDERLPAGHRQRLSTPSCHPDLCTRLDPHHLALLGKTKYPSVRNYTPVENSQLLDIGHFYICQASRGNDTAVTLTEDLSGHVAFEYNTGISLVVQPSARRRAT